MSKVCKVDQIRDRFKRALDSAIALVDAVSPLAAVKGAGHGRTLHIKHVRQVAELAFMGIVASWEEFLEQSMVRYLAGATSPSSREPVLRLGKCEDLSHSYQILTGKPSFDRTKHYISWIDPNEVIDKASIFFVGGKPYSTAIRPFKSELAHAIKLRNRVAHSSLKCIADFKKTANYYLQPGKVKQGYGLGDLLRQECRRDFTSLPPMPAGATRNYFKAHIDMFKILADGIVPP